MRTRNILRFVILNEHTGERLFKVDMIGHVNSTMRDIMEEVKLACEFSAVSRIANKARGTETIAIGIHDSVSFGRAVVVVVQMRAAWKAG